ncbi:MAG: STAS domain-containing protein [Gammaproteobacteria bacterium]|nr:STAS domain-containing protein [Gammaproteobacteria bacterium]
MSEDDMQEGFTPSSVELDLGEVLVISGLLELHEKAVAAIGSMAEITLDGSGIEQVDGVGLQLLVAVVKAASDKGLHVTWKGVSDTLRDSAAQLGLLQVLGLDIVPANS